MESTIAVQHMTQKVDASFETFTDNLEKMLGRFDYSIYRGSMPVRGKLRSAYRHDIVPRFMPPLRILVYEDGGGPTVVEFDLASSLFGNSGIPK